MSDFQSDLSRQNSSDSVYDTPSKSSTEDKKRKFFLTLSAKSRRFLSFRASRARSQTTTTPPVLLAALGGGGGINSGPHTTSTIPPSLLSLSLSTCLDINQDRGYSQESLADLRASTSSTGLSFDVLHDPDSPTLDARIEGGPTGEAATAEYGVLGRKDANPTAMTALSTEAPNAPLDIFQPTPAIDVSISGSAWSPTSLMRFAESASTYKSFETELTLERENSVVEEMDPPQPGKSSYLRVAQTLQQAARCVRDQDDLTQTTIIRTVAPLVIFLYIIGAGVYLPRNYPGPATDNKYDSTFNTGLLVAFFGGIGCTLLLLMVTIWVISTLGQAFCDMDLAATFQQSECVDAEGTRMGQGGLVIGSFLLGSESVDSQGK